MKIKTKLLLSYLSIIVIILVTMLFFSQRGMRALERRHLQSARRGIQQVVEANFHLSEALLTRAGEGAVSARSSSTALELALMLEKSGGNIFKNPAGTFNYEKIRASREIRSIVSRKIFTPGANGIQAGYTDLLDIHGMAVIHPNPSVEGQNYSRWKKEYPKMWALVKKSFSQKYTAGYYSFINQKNKPVRKFMVLTRVQGTPFIVTAVVSIDRFFRPAHGIIRKMGKRTRDSTDCEIEAASEQLIQDFYYRSILISVGMFFVAVILALWHAGTIAAPVQMLSKKVALMGEGDFSVSVPEQGSHEIKELAGAFNRLGGELALYMENLKGEIEARKSMESEIKVAREIQQNLLPEAYPAFPERNEFALYATLSPAKDVSGDFYDMFFPDEEKNKLVFVIADVSGKGVPAAIFMAVTRTLLRNLCIIMHDKTPGEILTIANNYLCRDNDAAMFVTVFLAYYDLSSGKLSYANAGHNPFVSVRNNRGISERGILEDFPMGIIEGHTYGTGEYYLEEEEKVIFYTDGVTDAVSAESEFFGKERFFDLLAQYADSTSIQIIEKLNSTLEAFQGDGQFDDITLMIFKRNIKK